MVILWYYNGIIIEGRAAEEVTHIIPINEYKKRTNNTKNLLRM